MTIRVDSSWIVGAIVVGDSGFGVLASDVPTTGTSGSAYLVNDITHYSIPPTSEVAGRILTFPSAGVLFANEDSSFTHLGAPQGTYTSTYQLYVDGVPTGEVATITTEFVDDRAVTISSTLPLVVSTMDVSTGGIIADRNISITSLLPLLSSNVTVTNLPQAVSLSINGMLPKLTSEMVVMFVASTSEHTVTIDSTLPKLNSSVNIRTGEFSFKVPEGNLVFIRLSPSYINIP